MTLSKGATPIKAVKSNYDGIHRTNRKYYLVECDNCKRQYIRRLDYKSKYCCTCKPNNRKGKTKPQSIVHIAKLVNVPNSTLYQWIKDEGLNPVNFYEQIFSK
jgi:ribosomal protein L37AE/L43A